MVPAVPRQGAGTNDCGVFAIKYLKKILSDPSEYVARVKAGMLRNWFNSRSLALSRKDLARQIVLKGKLQREMGEILVPFPSLPPI